MITLYGFGPALGLFDAGPFVLKVQAYLNVTGMEYEYESGFSAFRNAPKGKLPYIKHNGQLYADSYFIIEYLESLNPHPLDAELNEEQQAICHLVTRSLDENLYWCLVYSRWCIEETWQLFRPQMAATMPRVLGPLMLPVIRRNVYKQLRLQGFGLHSKEELLAIADRSLKSLSVLLGDKDYFFGDKPSTLDVAAYGMLTGMIDVDISNEFTEKARAYDNLCAFTQRIKPA